MTKKSDPPDADDSFQRLMSDLNVTPLQTEPRAATPNRAISPHPRRRDDDEPRRHLFIEREDARAISGEAVLQFARSGPQHSLLKRLRRGELPNEAKLDLHGHTIGEAAAALAEFLGEATRAACRCVLVVHGKGRRSNDDRAVLKSQLNHWLRDDPRVLAFHSARPQHGGSGALYVLLRRESAAK